MAELASLRQVSSPAVSCASLLAAIRAQVSCTFLEASFVDSSLFRCCSCDGEKTLAAVLDFEEQVAEACGDCCDE